ncbi:MAG: PDZ domain-containing protein [Candidatus Eisenbacteria bacterium]
MPAAGGEVEPLVFDQGSDGELDPTGTRLAFCHGLVPWWRQSYRGSAAQDVYVLSLDDRKVERVTAFDGCELWPRWEPSGKSIVFASDEFFARNLWRLDLSSGKRTQLTNHRDGAVEFPQVSADGQWAVYGHNGTIWCVGLHPLAPSRQLTIRIPDVDSGTASEDIDSRGAQRLVVAHDASFALIEAYGGIFKLDLDGSGGVADSGGAALKAIQPVRAVPLAESAYRDDGVALSPDDRRVIFSSDRQGGRDLYSVALDSTALGPPIPFRDNVREELAPRFSPDGRFVAYLRRDVGQQLMLADAAGGRETVLAKGVRFDGFSFSPDSRWIAYAKLDDGGDWDLYLLSLFSGDTYDVTRDPARDVDPMWTADGRMLCFRSDRAGSMDVWGLYLHESDAWEASLRAQRSAAGSPEDADDRPGAREPMSPASDGEHGDPAASGTSPADRRDGTFSIPDDVVIDLPGLAGRVVQITRFFGNESELALGEDGSLAVVSEVLGARDLWVFPGIGTPPHRVSDADPHALTWSAGAYWALDRDGRVLRIEGDRVSVHELRAHETYRRSERFAQILGETWRELRDGFYSPHMHLAPWEGVLARYRDRLPGVHTDEELHGLILRMVGELNASHLGFRSPPPADSLRTGDLGVRFVGVATSKTRGRADGALGDHVPPGLVVAGVVPGGPAARAGIAPGDRLLEVAGLPVGELLPLERILRGRVGESVSLVWSHGGEHRNAEVGVVGLDLARTLSREQETAWKRDLTEKAGRGRIGYVAVRAIDHAALTSLRRDLDAMREGGSGRAGSARQSGRGSPGRVPPRAHHEGARPASAARSADGLRSTSSLGPADGGSYRSWHRIGRGDRRRRSRRSRTRVPRRGKDLRRGDRCRRDPSAGRVELSNSAHWMVHCGWG